MPPISTFTWATDEPNIAGSISVMTRFTPSWPAAHFGRGKARIRSRNGTWKNSWKTPAMKTAYARAMPGSSSSGASQMAQAIRTTFRMTGVNAGTAKRP